MKSKELFIITFLSYINFSKEDIGRKVIDIFNDDKRKKILKKDFVAMFSTNKKYHMDFFKNEYENLEVFYVENKTYFNEDGNKISGYYALGLKNSQGKYFLSFRGSERFPLEDAYMDFIRTDLVYGLAGSIPKQFYEGVASYQKILSSGIKKEDLILTGHSLGGGIAQYVSVISSVRNNFIPTTYTFNAVGVDRDGILSVKDFIHFNDIFIDRKYYNSINKKLYLNFFETYKNFIEKEYKELLKKDKKYLEKDIDIYIWFKKNYFIQANVSKIAKTLSLNLNVGVDIDKLINDENIIKLFSKEKINQFIDYLNEANQKIKNKANYYDKITNFGTEDDLTNSLYSHFGKHILLDKGLIEGDIKNKKSIKYNLKLLTKSFAKNHAEIAFIPFIDKKGNFCKEMSLDYVAAVLRKIIHCEQFYESNIMADYLERKNIDDEILEKYKSRIMQDLKNTNEEIVHRKQIYELLEKMNIEDFRKIWKLMYKRIASPYRFIDIYDVIVWRT